MRRPSNRTLRWIAVALYVGVACYLTVVLAAYLSVLSARTHAQGLQADGAPIPHIAQDAQWVARKLAHQVRRPQRPGEAHIEPACVAPCTQYPTLSSLDTSVVERTLEPGSSGTDAAGKVYADRNMPHLCGPGAAANTLYFWGNYVPAAGKLAGRGAAALSGGVYRTDTANGVMTYWDNQYNRSYLLYLAWEAQVPGWPHKGMMGTHDPSEGVTLYGMRDTLNWEASRSSQATWKQYFYTLVWWDQSSSTELHRAVQDDIANSRVPVVAEVNARLLPNWPSAGAPIKHYITIVGYDDVQGTYDYTDTCGHSTGCGSKEDGGVHTVSQAQMWAAITAVPINRSTASNGGDGGYIW
jgi:hypothetical protein